MHPGINTGAGHPPDLIRSATNREAVRECSLRTFEFAFISDPDGQVGNDGVEHSVILRIVGPTTGALGGQLDEGVLGIGFEPENFTI